MPDSTPNTSGFAAGTLVHTKEGLKPIETIQVGDWVLSKHESGEGEREYKRVTRTFVHEDRAVIKVGCGGQQADGSDRYHLFVVTPEHPFWVQGKGWKEVGKLKPKFPAWYFELLSPENATIAGNVRLFKTDQPDVAWHPTYDKSHMLQCTGWRFHVPTVKPIEQDVFIGNESVRRTGRVKPEDLNHTTVCNIEVEDFHTYYVGEVGVWVKVV